MGAESFFIIFIESESKKNINSLGEYCYSGSKKISLNDFPTIKKLNCKLLRPMIFDELGFIQALSFEGCFSCYEKCLEELEMIFTTYLSKCDSLMIYDSKENIKLECSGFACIKKFILNKNDQRYKRYNEIFHNFKTECLPDSQFYKMYQRRNINNFFSFLKEMFVRKK